MKNEAVTLKANSRRPTLKELALETGMSRQSISLILNGNRKYPYSQKTREKVLEAAKKIGYKPNRAAQAIRNGRFNSVGLLLKNDEYWIDMPKRVVKGLDDTFRQANYDSIHIKLRGGYSDESGIQPGFISENMVDGLIIGYENESLCTSKDIIENSRSPIIWVNRKVDYNSVRPDDEQAAVEITEELLALGHRKILYANYSNISHYSAKDRALGYEKTMIKAGLTPWIIEEIVPRDKRIEESRKFLDRSDRPTAIITYGGTTALPIMFSFTALNGLCIPEKLSVVSFGGNIDDSIGIPLSTIRYNEETIGAESAKLLVRRIESDGDREESIIVPPSKIVGGTCARVPSTS